MKLFQVENIYGKKFLVIAKNFAQAETFFEKHSKSPVSKIEILAVEVVGEEGLLAS